MMLQARRMPSHYSNRNIARNEAHGICPIIRGPNPNLLPKCDKIGVEYAMWLWTSSCGTPRLMVVNMFCEPGPDANHDFNAKNNSGSPLVIGPNYRRACWF